MLEILFNHYPVLLEGLATTLVVSLSAIALGLVLGVLLAFGLTSRYGLLRWPCGLYRSFGAAPPSCCNYCWSTICCPKSVLRSRLLPPPF